MTGPNFIKEIPQNDLDSKGIKIDFKQLDALLEIKFKDYIAADKELSDKYGVGAKIDLKDQKKREDLQKDFNDYIDKERNKAEKSDIDKALKEFQLELNTLQIEIEIGALHDEVISGNVEDNTEKSDTETIKNQIETGVAPRLRNQLTTEKIAGELSKLGSADQNKLIDLLSKGDIKSFQTILGLENLPKYGADGKIGTETFKALEKYAENNKVDTKKEEKSQEDEDIKNDKTPEDKNKEKNNPVDENNNEPGAHIEVTDKLELEKITKKQFDISEFSRGKIQKDANGNYFAEIKSTIDPQKSIIGTLEFDKDGNLIPGKYINTSSKEREPLYFADENKIKFVAISSDGMYLTKDSITGVTPTEKPEEIKYEYDATEFDLLEGNRVEYQFQSDLGYEVLDKHIKLKKIMDEIINEQEGAGDLSKRKFKINLSPNDGLARIILDIYSSDSKNAPAKLLQKKDGTISIKDIKKCFPYYDRAGGLDSEKRKIAMILNQADKKDLVNFAYDAQSYGEDYEDKFQKADRFDQVLESLTSDNILESLCDYNLDGQLSAVEGRTQFKQKFLTDKGGKYPGRREDFRQYKQERKDKNKDYKKSQESIGDTGTIFGPQLYHELQRAIAVMDVKLKNEPNIRKEYCNKYNLPETTVLTGENIVLTNIIKNISWISSNPTLEQAIGKVPANLWTKAKLLEMAKNYTGKDGLDNNGNFQPLFAKAIEEINGSSSSISPDLFDNLVGVERMYTDVDRYTMIQKELETYLSAHPDEALRFKSDGFTDTKHTFITGLMSAFDNLQITASPQFLNVTKSWDIQKYRHKLENSFAKNLIGGGLTVQPDGTMGLQANIGKTDFSENGKFQWNRNAGAGTHYNIQTGILSVSLNIGAEAAWEYNYDKVVMGRLDDIKSAKYIGIGGGAVAAGAEVGKQIVVGGIAGAEIDWKQNPKQAIEQMNRQYSDISDKMFYLPPSIDSKNLKNSAALESFLTGRLNMLKTGAKEPIKSFIINNEGFFKGNIKNIADYFDKKGIFAMMDKIPKEFQGEKKRNAINNLMQVLQTGIVDCRKDYMYDQLHGKVSVTKIGAGVGIGYATINGVGRGVPFPMLSFNISTWRKNYVSSEAGKYMDQEIIRSGETQGRGDEFQPESNDLNVYAEYIKARYNNLPGLEVVVKDGKFEFTYSDPNGGDKQIGDILNIRCKLDQKVLDNVKYSDDGSTLTIGNVGDLGIFSSADGQGVRNFLVIGQKGTVDKDNKANTFILKPGHPPADYQGESKDIQPITMIEDGYKAWTLESINNLLDTNFKAQGENYTTNIQDIKYKIKSKIKPIGGDLFIDGLNSQVGLSKFPTTGTLTFIEDNKGNITINSISTPGDKLNINYKKYTKEIITGKITTTEITNDWKNLFSFTDIDSLFSDIVGLSKLDNGKVTKLGEFLDNASNDIDNDGDIDAQEYENASGILKELLGKNYPEIAKVLEGNDISKKVLVINRMKGIFATELGVTNYKTLKNIITLRKDVYKNLVGPSKEILPAFNSDYRKSILDKLSDKTNISQDVQDGLFGYTAFYRKGTGEGRRYSLTAPGATKALGGETMSFEKNDEKLARDWFIKNLEKDKASLAIITQSINDKLTSGIRSLSSTDAIKLLSGESLDIGGENNITISLNSQMSFYLLGECANESIGIKINGIKIKSKHSQPSSTVDKDTEAYSGDIAPEKKYTGKIDISSRNLSVPMVPGAYQHDVGVNLLGNKKPKEQEGGDQGVEEEGGDQGSGG